MYGMSRLAKQIAALTPTKRKAYRLPHYGAKESARCYIEVMQANGHVTVQRARDERDMVFVREAA